MDYRTMGDIFKGLGEFDSIALAAAAVSSMLQSGTVLCSVFCQRASAALLLPSALPQHQVHCSV
jgi:hypothetical protein